MSRASAVMLNEGPQYGDRSCFWLGLALFCSMALLLTIVWKPTPLLVWNASSSVPQGLYLVHSAVAPQRGETVVAWLAPSARRIAATRGYLPWTVPLVKPIAASAGDRVCARGQEIMINGRLAAIRQSSDSRGRALPFWNGCVRLGRGEYFLLSSAAGSFDGRYFGVVRSSQVIGSAEFRR